MEDIPLDIDDRPTVRSIAVHAGVSASTVSRALKGDPARLPRNSRPHHGHRTRARLHPQRYRAVAGHSLQWRDRRRARPGAGPLATPSRWSDFTSSPWAAGKQPMLLHLCGTMLDTETMQTVFQYQMGGCGRGYSSLGGGTVVRFP